MKLTREHVLHVAELAHLELTETEVELYSRQLDAILAYVEKLNQLDTSDVEPMAQVLSGEALAENPSLRDDALASGDVIDAVLDIAPNPSRPYFRVPRVIER